MILVLAKAVACWLHSLSSNQHDRAFCTLHASCRYSDHGALSLSQSKDFLRAESTCVFFVEVAVKKPLRRPWFFPYLSEYRAGSEPCCSGSAEWRIPWQIYWRHLRRAEVTGRLEAQDASLISLLAFTYRIVCARLTGTVPVNSPGAKTGIPLSRLLCTDEVEEDLCVGGYFFHSEHLHSQHGAKALPL